MHVKLCFGCLATPGLAALARREQIYLDQRFSDHAPLTIDYDLDL